MPLVDAVDFQVCLSAAGECPLRPLTGSAQAAQSSVRFAKIQPVLPLELCHKVVDHDIIKVLTPEMGVASRGSYLVDAIFNRQ